MGGLPGVRFEIQGVDVESTLVSAFDGQTVYQLMCQSTAENETEMDQAASRSSAPSS